jgi:uncharacterized OsmC-like protein
MSTNVIEASIEKFTADPGAGRSAPAVTATLANGRARLSAGPFNWDADLPPAVGGANLAPSPTAYLLGALAGCAVVFIRDTVAPQLGLQIDDVRATARCTADARGLLGMDGAVPDLGDVAVDIAVDSPEPPERLHELFAIWKARCPIFLALLKPNAVESTFSSVNEQRQPGDAG